MKRNLNALQAKEFDLLVVGGGMFGACAAWEGASRGLSVAIIEKRDFGRGSSANHLKMVHGGIRYLQHGDIYRVRESSHERSAFLRIAPHLVSPLPIVIPTYGHGMKGKEVLGTGLFMYDLLTADRNRGIKDSRRKVPWGNFLSRDEVMDFFPGLEKEKLTGGAVFNDGQMYNPPRLVMSFLRSAVDAGAEAANYLEMVRFLRSGARVTGVEARDVLTGDTLEIRSKLVLNTTGGWAPDLLAESPDLRIDPKPSFSRDLAFVVKRPLVKKYGFACPLKTKDVDAVFDRGGRHLFVAPWRDHTLVGVWHVIYKGDPEDVSTTEEELEGYLTEVNEAHPAFDLKLDDVAMILTGLTLFGEEGEQAEGKMSFGKRSRLIDHGKKDGIDGLITLIGVRATTARGEAEKAINLVFKKIGRTGTKSQTAFTPIFGGKIDSIDALEQEVASAGGGKRGVREARALARNYGTQFTDVLSYAEKDSKLSEALGSSSVLKAEVIHGIDREMAKKLADIVFRRTDLGTGGNPGDDAVRACGEIMAKELGWDEAALEKELQEVDDIFKRRGYLQPHIGLGDTK